MSQSTFTVAGLREKMQEYIDLQPEEQRLAAAEALDVVFLRNLDPSRTYTIDDLKHVKDAMVQLMEITGLEEQ